MRSLFDFQADLYIYLSTMDVYDSKDNLAKNSEDSAIRHHELTAYGFHKWLSERLVEKYSNRHLILRLGTAIGPGLKKGPVFDLISGNPVPMDPTSTLSLIHTQVISEVVRKLTDKGQSYQGIYNLTGKGSVSVESIARELEVSIKRQTEIGTSAQFHKYDINVEKLSRIIPLPSSIDAVRQFKLRKKGHLDFPDFSHVEEKRFFDPNGFKTFVK